MGVHGLWDLLAPVGHRVSVETLAGKRLAIDASIWMVQFMKAMRDEKGEMVRNAHLLGFFRRICKLLFLRTKPVFVFDGGTPTLKRRTVIARRRQRENAQAKIRKTAEKLFLNQMKAMRLSNLAENLKDQRGVGSSKGKEVMVEQSDTLEKHDAGLGVKNQEFLDELLAASIIAEECGGVGSTGSTIAAPYGNASKSSTSAKVFTVEDEDTDDEEMIMPVTDGNVDPAVLASLPPSMQLDLLTQMRERLMAENRQKYQKVKKVPQKFSELQIEAYLKTVAFRREIDEVQRAAAGRGVGGVQTSCIASESNREFIFSSSFSGDKQVLASSGVEKFSEKQQPGEKMSSSVVVDVIAASASKADAEPGPEVETYLDDRGRKRIHRSRAMGIRMTHDLQRNIDLMKESEHTCTTSNETNNQTELDAAVDPPQNLVHEGQVFDASISAPKTESFINISFVGDGKPISVNEDDAFFTRLVAGNPPTSCSDDNSDSEIEWEDGTGVKQNNSFSVQNKQETSSAHAEDASKNESDVEWEEVPSIAIGMPETNIFHVDNHKDSEIQPIIVDSSNTISKGSAEEEFALQEAIKRSLEDVNAEKTSVSLNLEKSNYGSEIETVLDGIERPQAIVKENYHSSVLADKVAYALSTSDNSYDKSSKPAVDDARTVLSTSEDEKKNLHLQQPDNSSENSEISNLGNDGSDKPILKTISTLSSSLSVPLIDDMRNEEVTAGTSNMPIGHGAPVTELQTPHANILRKTAENDAGFVSVLERGHNVLLTDPHEDVTSDELFGARLEDELLVLDKEYKDLENEQKKHERNADSVNSEMFVECQELLQMFGLPYIIAPMEAEAQCAFLELSNLVDGVVTDDSDVFLFGARSVFKNIFDDHKYVETYLLKDIETELGLNTEKLIRMALLLGSDYTEGVSGIGIVNAIEVVNAFPEDDGLKKFREWVESPDPSILGKLGMLSGSSVNNGLKGTSTADCNSSEENEDSEAADRRKGKQLFMNKHRNVSKNWHLPASFPSDAVVSAYKSPQVDKSAEPFSWGKPDLFSLRRLCSEKFTWPNQKADELLLPVLKEYNKHETQLRLEAFYTFNEKFANIRSKRIRQAVKGITGKRSLANADDLLEKPKSRKRGENTSERSNTKKKDNGEKKNSSKRSKSSKREVKVGEMEVDGTCCGRGKGNRSGKTVRRGKGVQSSDSEPNETSTCNLSGSSDEHENVLRTGKTLMLNSVRRSKRARKSISYVEKDDVNDEKTKFLSQPNVKCRNDEGKHNSFKCQDSHKSVMVEASRQQEATSDEDMVCGDYLTQGGGFCAIEDNEELTSNREGPIQNDGEYLQMGGGFCTDDAEHVDFQDRVQVLPNSPSLLSNENPNEEHKSPDINFSIVGQTVGDDSRASVSAFSAIPFLRKKKRKT